MSGSTALTVPFCGGTASAQPRLPGAFFETVRRCGAAYSRNLLWVRVSRQELWRCVVLPPLSRAQRDRKFPHYVPVGGRSVVSTSRFGIGQRSGSNRTPLGLHRVARKIGAGWPVGTVFRGRQPVGYTWKGQPDAMITTRILWLEGLEPGLNRGGDVDSFSRYIYIHGTGDELTLGRPASCGCVHVAAKDLVPLFDSLPLHTLVWISD